jgi:hypothetical protein
MVVSGRAEDTGDQRPHPGKAGASAERRCSAASTATAAPRRLPKTDRITWALCANTTSKSAGPRLATVSNISVASLPEASSQVRRPERMREAGIPPTAATLRVAGPGTGHRLGLARYPATPMTAFSSLSSLPSFLNPKLTPIARRVRSPS